MSEPVHLVVDARSLELKWAGIAWYIHGVVCQMAADHPDLRITLLGRTAPDLRRFPGLENVAVAGDPNKLAARIKSILWLKSRAGGLVRRLGGTHFWGAAGLLPSGMRIPCAVTVHDLNHLIVPETMSFLTRLGYGAFLGRDARRASRVFTNSRSTAERLEAMLGLRSHGVVHPELRSVLLDSRATRPETLEDGPFFLSAATNEPRKNISAAIDAFLSAHSKGAIGDARLVLVGDRGWKNEAVRERIEGAGRGRILHLGYVSNEELAWLYQNCRAFLFPSIYEGFGMPVQEARALGARVVCTDMPELREAGDEHCIYVSPDVEGIGRGISEAWNATGPVGRKTYDRNLFQRQVADFAESFLGLRGKDERKA